MTPNKTKVEGSAERRARLRREAADRSRARWKGGAAKAPVPAPDNPPSVDPMADGTFSVATSAGRITVPPAQAAEILRRVTHDPPRLERPADNDVCECNHVAGWHRHNLGTCDFPQCRCVAFTRGGGAA